MNLREKYYYFQDDSGGKLEFDLENKYYFYENDEVREERIYLKEIEDDIKIFEEKYNLKITEDHKNFLLTFPIGAYINGMFDNRLVFDNCIDIIYDINTINRLFFGLKKFLYEDARKLELIPFASSSGQIECYIGGGEDNLGDVYFLDDSEPIENRVLICKGFDTFMSGYKKTEGYD